MRSLIRMSVVYSGSLVGGNVDLVIMSLSRRSSRRAGLDNQWACGDAGRTRRRRPLVAPLAVFAARVRKRLRQRLLERHHGGHGRRLPHCGPSRRRRCGGRCRSQGHRPTPPRGPIWSPSDAGIAVLWPARRRHGGGGRQQRIPASATCLPGPSLVAVSAGSYHTVDLDVDGTAGRLRSNKRGHKPGVAGQQDRRLSFSRLGAITPSACALTARRWRWAATKYGQCDVSSLASRSRRRRRAAATPSACAPTAPTVCRGQRRERPAPVCPASGSWANLSSRASAGGAQAVGLRRRNVRCGGCQWAWPCAPSPPRAICFAVCREGSPGWPPLRPERRLGVSATNVASAPSAPLTIQHARRGRVPRMRIEGKSVPDTCPSTAPVRLSSPWARNQASRA